MTTQPNIDDIAREAALAHYGHNEAGENARLIVLLQTRIDAAIRRAMIDEHDEAIEVLKLVEWRGDYLESCPLCGNSINSGHSPGCRLATAIGK